MKKREDEEKQKEEEEQQVYGCSVSSKAKAVPTCYYLVQSPSSVSSSLCRSVVNHHHHHHHSHLLTSSKPAINPVLVAHHHDDNDDEADEEDGNVSAGSNYRITKTTTSFNMNIMSRCSSSRASLTSIFLEDQDDQHSLLNNNNHHHLIPLLPPIPPPNHHHYDDASAILVNNANENPTFPTPTTKLIAYQYHHHHGRHIKKGDDDDDDDDEKPGGGCCCRYLSSKTFPSSNLWIALQLLWRLFFSFMVALLVFYLATKPPSPHVSIQVGGVKQFELAEGVDSSGVGTNFLTCNLSMVVVIDNKSKVYSLHLHPLRLAIYFGRIPLVVSQQEGREEEEVKNEEKREIRVSGGVTGKAMYGAGREMEDALKTTEKGGNLELVTKVSVESYYRVVGNLIRPKFHHRALCFVSLHNFYDHQHATQAFNSTCRLSVS